MLLTLEQEAAVANVARHKRIIAVAGAGKTTLLVEQIGRWLRDGADPEAMLAITFTRRAGETIRSRVRREHGIDIGYAGTIHGMAYLALAMAADGAHRQTPLTDAETDAVVDHVASVCSLRSKVCPKVKKAAQGDEPKRWGDAGEQALATHVARYMRSNRLVHVSSLVHHFVAALQAHADVRAWFRRHARTILWDEYQDVDDAEAQILGLVEPDRTFIVGDPQQAIYGFRGANSEHLWQAQVDATWPITMNFRSGARILDVANLVQPGAGLDLRPFKTNAGDVRGWFSSVEQHSPEVAAIAAGVMLRETGGPVHILCRTNHEIVEVSAFLEQQGIAAMVASPGFDRYAQPEWRKAFLAARYAMDPQCEWLATKAKSIGMCRPVESPETTEVGHLVACYSAEDASVVRQDAKSEMTLPDFVAWYQRRDLQDLLPGADAAADAVIMTAHASKGLEFENVVVVGVGSSMGVQRGKTAAEDAEERNLLYVAVTRAMSHLALVGRREAISALGVS